MMNSVRWLEDASQTVRLADGWMDEGRMNGNIDAPTLSVIPAMDALLTAALGIAGIILSVGASMFPFILPSSIDPRASLTVWDSSSSHLTLFIMLVVTAFFIPIIVAYTSWVYHVLWGKVDEQAIRDESGHAY